MSRNLKTSVRDEDWFRDPGLQRILSLLNRDEGEARVVGGAVRNALIGQPVKDVDIATTLEPPAVVARAEEAGIKAVPTGIDHGTVTLVIAGRPYEVTTLRADVETDGRRAKVAFGTDWDTDAKRRDLTMNALYAAADGTVIDPVGGLPDLAGGIVRFIGEPEQRIAEDALRILRFFRFFAWYGSGRPEGEGLKACAKARTALASLSAERVWAELKALLKAPDPGRALLWMRQTGVLTEILSESEKWGIDAVPSLVRTEGAFGWTPDPLLRLAAIVPPDVERVKALAVRLKMSRAEAGRLAAWAAAAMIAYDTADHALDRLLYAGSPQGISDRLMLSLAAARQRAISDSHALVEAAAYSRLVERAARWERPTFPVTGHDLAAAGIAPGPAMGALQRRLETVWIDSHFRLDRDALLARIEGDGEGVSEDAAGARVDDTSEGSGRPE